MNFEIILEYIYTLFITYLYSQGKPREIASAFLAVTLHFTLCLIIHICVRVCIYVTETYVF